MESILLRTWSTFVILQMFVQGSWIWEQIWKNSKILTITIMKGWYFVTKFFIFIHLNFQMKFDFIILVSKYIKICFIKISWKCKRILLWLPIIVIALRPFMTHFYYVQVSRILLFNMNNLSINFFHITYYPIITNYTCIYLIKMIEFCYYLLFWPEFWSEKLNQFSALM